MSLLLDALQRASKDKERLAAATGTQKPILGSSKPNENRLSAKDFPALNTDAQAPLLMPRLDVGTVDKVDPDALSLLAEPATEAESHSGVALALEPELLAVAETASTPAHAAQPQIGTQDDYSARDALLHGASAARAASIDVSSDPPAAKQRVAPPPAQRTAQDIRRAYGSKVTGGSGSNRRLIILGTVAGVLALAIGSVFFGLWGDPEALLGLSGQSSLVPTAQTAPMSPTLPLDATASVTQLPLQAPSLADSASATATASVSAIASPAISPTAPALAPTTPVPVSRAPALALEIKEAQASSSANKPPKPAGVPIAPTVELAKSTSRAVTPTLASKPVASLLSTVSTSAEWLQRGYADLLAGRLDAAALSYGQVLAVNPDERDALLGMAYIQFQQGQSQQAQISYRRVLRQDPANVTARSALLALAPSGDSTLMAGRARELAASQPESASAMAALGSALVREGLLADAALAFAKAQAIEPDNPLHAYNHAVALDRLGQFAAALVQYEKVLAVWNPSSALAARSLRIETVRQRVAQLQPAVSPLDEAAK